MTLFTVLPFLHEMVIFFGETADVGDNALTRIVGLENVNPEAVIFSSL